MNTTVTLNRRAFLHKATVTGLAVLGAATLPSARSALADSGPGQFICQYNNVRLRDNYGLSGNVIGTLNVGDVVNVSGDYVDADGYNWMYVTVTLTGTQGWTATEFFEPVIGSVIWPAGTTVHVNSGNVNLRSGPGLGYGVIGTYDAGTNATVVAGPEQADGYSWHKITIDGVTGWMATDFLALGAGDDSGGGDWDAGTTVHVTSNNVNMRSGAGLNFGILTSFDTGATGTITAGPFPNDGYEWYELRIDGTTGYMVAEFLAEGVGDGGNGGGGPIGATMHVATDALNLRTDPNTSSRVVMTLTQGTTVTISDGPVYADGYTWYEVTFPGSAGVGWVAGEYLAEGSGGAEPTGARLRVIDGPLNMRFGPSLDSEILTSLPNGTVVIIRDASFVQADGYIWMEIYLENQPSVAGWIAQGFTEEI